jgi:NADH:ubiquinone oxidoreductase subunit 5 (subunit L)/multisubunit Na+/H+ antiporter MnhA subunit
MYVAEWVVVLLPILGALLSFVAETSRRAAQVCMAGVAGSLLVALIVLGYRFAHLTTSATPDVSAVSFFTLLPNSTETTIYSSTFSTDTGVWVDNLSTAFTALVTFLLLLVQGLATAMLRGDPGYRRFFWVSSVLAGAVLGMIAAPSLFQVWMALGLVTGGLLALALHRWHRDETGPAAWRAFMVLFGADLVLLLGLVVTVYKLGATMGLENAPAGFTSAPDYDFRMLATAWRDAASPGTVGGTGYRTLVILCLLLAVPALVRAAQAPVTAWLSGLSEAPLPVLGAACVSLLTGVVLLARIYGLLLVTRHALSALALAGAVGAVGLAALCLASRDIYRIALLSAAGQLALAVTALGAGGYSPGLLIAFVSAPVSLLLLVAAGSVARAYRTRDIRLMGGAWSKMRRTSVAIGLWAALAAGLDLVGYDALSAILLNRFPGGGHMAAGVQAAVAVLTVAALVLIPLYAARLVLSVCAGAPAPRRGGVVERIAEAEPRLRLVQAATGAAAVVAVLIGLPGISAAGRLGRGQVRIPGLTFSHWVFFGAHRQDLPVQPWAFLIAAVALAAGVAGAWALARVPWDDLRRRLPVPTLSTRPAIALVGTWTARLAGTLPAEVFAADQTLIAPLFDAPGEGLEVTAWSLGRWRGRRLRLSLAAVLAVVLLLTGFSVLAGGGRLPVHTT